MYAWRSQARQRSQSGEEQRLLQAEVARLKRENARLEEEAAFLKKAAAAAAGGGNQIQFVIPPNMRNEVLKFVDGEKLP